MKNLCIIPARGGSKRIPRKNIKPFLGKPIMAYSIEAALNAGIFDEVMVSIMKAPRTYTREDVVEINCHGGVLVVKKVLSLVLKNGARLAGSGEFTKRAFLNGRIDLSQAEAIMDLINAKSELALEVSVGNLEGRISEKIKKLREILIYHIVCLKMKKI